MKVRMIAMAQSKTVVLRTILQKKLKEQVANVYYDIRPEALKYPCIIYELWEVTHEDMKTIMSLEANVLDYGTKTTQAETIADNIQKTLYKYHFINKTIQFMIYQGTRQVVQEDDKKIIRRRLTFEIQLYDRKVNS